MKTYYTVSICIALGVCVAVPLVATGTYYFCDSMPVAEDMRIREKNYIEDQRREAEEKRKWLIAKREEARRIREEKEAEARRREEEERRRREEKEAEERRREEEERRQREKEAAEREAKAAAERERLAEAKRQEEAAKKKREQEKRESSNFKDDGKHLAIGGVPINLPYEQLKRELEKRFGDSYVFENTDDQTHIASGLGGGYRSTTSRRFAEIIKLLYKIDMPDRMGYQYLRFSRKASYNGTVFLNCVNGQGVVQIYIRDFKDGQEYLNAFKNKYKNCVAVPSKQIPITFDGDHGIPMEGAIECILVILDDGIVLVAADREWNGMMFSYFNNRTHQTLMNWLKQLKGEDDRNKQGI